MASKQMAETVAQVLEVMRQMTANAPKSIPADVLEIWCAVLESAGLTPDEVRRTAGTYIAREKFFPTVADFLAIARPSIDAEVQAEAAWLNVRRCLSDYGCYASLTAADLDGDECALWALSRLGYDEELGGAEDRERAFKRAEFVRYYAVAREKGHTLNHLAGRLECENRANARDLTPALCGRPDWTALPAAVRDALPEPEPIGLAPAPLALAESAR
jgi:hypothetical protein